MNIIINLSTINGGGAMQVACATLQEIKSNNDNLFYVIISPSLNNEVKKIKFNKNFKFINLRYHISKNIFILSYYILYLNYLEARYKIDIVFTLFGPSYWTPKSIHLMGYAIPHYVYEDSPYFKNFNYKKYISYSIKKNIQLFLIKRNSKLFHVETDDVKYRLNNLLKIPLNNIYTIGSALHPCFNDLTLRNNIKLNINENLKLLILSSSADHKNLLVIKKIKDELLLKYKLNVSFLTTLPDDYYNKFLKDRNIINIYPLYIENCPSLYDYCDFVFAPSLLECFSSVYAEAMFMRKPLLVSDLPFSRHVCSDAAIYFDPLSYIDMASKIYNLYINKKLQFNITKNGINRLKTFPTTIQRTNSYFTILVNEHIKNNK